MSSFAIFFLGGHGVGGGAGCGSGNDGPVRALLKTPQHSELRTVYSGLAAMVQLSPALLRCTKRTVVVP